MGFRSGLIAGHFRTFKLLHNFIPDLSGVFLGLHDVVWSLRFSNKLLRASQNSCIYTEIKLHTDGLYVLIR